MEQQPYQDTDGHPLLFADAIEELTGWTTETIRHYATAGNRARSEGTVLGDYDRLVQRAAAAEAALAEAGNAGRATAGAERRVAGYRAQLRYMPQTVKKVRRTMTKADGKPLVVWSPLWREDQIRTWLRARGVLGDEQE